MSAYYAQVIAEELCVQPESITLLMGDTDRTPDGGYSAGLLSGAANLRKVGAYTYQALLGLAADKLRLPVSALTVTDGVVSARERVSATENSFRASSSISRFQSRARRQRSTQHLESV